MGLCYASPPPSIVQFKKNDVYALTSSEGKGTTNIYEDTDTTVSKIKKKIS